MHLFVDGAEVAANKSVRSAQSYNGYWRIGGDNLGGAVNRPTSNYLAGSIDEVAIYPTQLSAAQVTAHYRASGR